VNAEADQLPDDLEPGALESMEAGQTGDADHLSDEEYGSKVKKRIAKEVYKRKKLGEDLEHEQGENARLRQELNGMRADQHKEREDSLKAREEEAAKRARTAFDAGETDDYMKANDELLDAKVDRRTLGDAPKPAAEESSKPKMTEAAENWVGRNQDMIENDPDKFARAQEIEAELRSQGYRPSDPKLYDEVDKRLNGTGSDDDLSDEDHRMQGDSHLSVPNRGETGGDAGKGGKTTLTKEDLRLMDKYGFDHNNVEHRKRWLASKKEV